MERTFRSDLPIYAQLVEQFRQDIVSGALPPGARLNSVRDLAAESGVNPNTMQRALQELERDGLVYSQRTNGRFVTEDTAVIGQWKERLARSQIDSFLAAMAPLGYGRQAIIALLQEEKEENA